MFFAWSVASISAYIFGHDATLNLLHNVPEARRLLEEYFSQRAYQFVGALLPIPPQVFSWWGYQPELRWVQQMQYHAEKARKERSQHVNADGYTNVYGFTKQSLDKFKQDNPNTELSAKELAVLSSEMQDHMVAGIDTSIAALAACAWLLSLDHNRHWQDQLREEIHSTHGPFRYRNLDQLPVLNAIIKETLRLYPPVAAGQPRVTDKTVILGPRDQEIAVPPGVKVHCQAHSLHRSGMFNDPENFHPERWIDGAPEKRKEMDRWFWAFGSGSRRCVGENLALSNLRVAITSIWGNFETLPTDRTRFSVSQGIIAMPLPQEDGNFIRLHVRRWQRS